MAKLKFGSGNSESSTVATSIATMPEQSSPIVIEKEVIVEKIVEIDRPVDVERIVIQEKIIEVPVEIRVPAEVVQKDTVFEDYVNAKIQELDDSLDVVEALRQKNHLLSEKHEMVCDAISDIEQQIEKDIVYKINESSSEIALLKAQIKTAKMMNLGLGLAIIVLTLIVLI